MLEAYKEIIMSRHFPTNTKATFANAQKFIHLRRQSVPLFKAVELSAKKIRAKDREDVDTMIKQATLMRFSEQHYDYEHIAKQYEHFLNTHNIIDGLIITELNEGCIDKVLDPEVYFTISPDNEALIRRRLAWELQVSKLKQDKEGRKGTIRRLSTLDAAVDRKMKEFVRQRKSDRLSRRAMEAHRLHRKSSLPALRPHRVN
jgi:hypothetical protein